MFSFCIEIAVATVIMIITLRMTLTEDNHLNILNHFAHTFTYISFTCSSLHVNCMIGRLCCAVFFSFCFYHEIIFFSFLSFHWMSHCWTFTQMYLKFEKWKKNLIASKYIILFVMQLQVRNNNYINLFFLVQIDDWNKRVAWT